MSEMLNPFKTPSVIDGGAQEKEIADIFMDNVDKGIVSYEEFSVYVDKIASKDSLKKNVEKGYHQYPDIYDVKVKEALANVFEHTEKFFARTNYDVPTYEQFQENDVDFAHLAAEYLKMERENLQPMFVIAPYNLWADDWRELYGELANSPAGNGVLDRSQHYHNFLSAIDSEWKWQHIAQYKPIPAKYIPDVEITDMEKGVTVDWTIRIVSAAEDAGERDNSYDDNYDHMTISEYLTMQAVRIEQGLPPVDKNTFTWLHGKHDESAPYATFGQSEGLIQVRTRPVVRGAGLPMGRRKVAW